jgi:hypothetical protein
MNKPISEWTLEDYANHYVDVINSESNAWGQHLSPIFNCASTGIMIRGYKLFGEDAFNSMVDSKLNQWRE